MTAERYPLSMYKGEREKAEQTVVRNKAEEEAAEKDGYVDGHKFFTVESAKPKLVHNADDEAEETHERRHVAKHK